MASGLGTHLSSDILAFNGSLVYPVDEVVRDVIEVARRSSKSPKLSVILTTDGGYIEVVHRIRDTLRHHYKTVDFLVPNYAYSAGTVLVMSGDAIWMNYFSRLGPIDPQIKTSSGRQVSALGYLIYYEQLMEKGAAGTLTPVEAAQLMSFDLAEIADIRNARDYSIDLLKRWLVGYKFKNWKVTEKRKLKVTTKMKRDRAEEIAKILNDTDRWHSHGYGISMAELRRDLKLQIDDFDGDLHLAESLIEYHGLLSDYMVKNGDVGVLHSPGQYVPFHVHV
jgi:hypothetical protein